MFDGVQAELFATSLASIVKLSDFISDFFFIHDLVQLDQQVTGGGDSSGNNAADYTYLIGGSSTATAEATNDNGGRFLEEAFATADESSSSNNSRWLPVKTYIALASIFTIVGVLFDMFLIYVAIKEHRAKKAQEKEHQRTASDVFWQEGLVSSTFWSKAVGGFFESDATKHQENWVWWRHANFVLEEIPQLILLVVFYIDWSRSFADSSTNSDSYWQHTKASIFVSAAFTSIMVIKVSVGYILYRRNRRKWKVEQAKANAGIMASMLSLNDTTTTPSSSPRSQQSNTVESKKRSILCKSAAPNNNDLEQGRKRTKEERSGSRWSFFPSNTSSPSTTKKGKRNMKQKAKPLKDNSYSSSFFSGLKEEECENKQSKRGSFMAACSSTNIQERRPTPTARIIADAIKQRKDKNSTVANNNDKNSKTIDSNNKSLGFSTMSLIPLGRTDSTCSSLSKSSSTSTNSKRKRRQQKASTATTSLSTISTRLFPGADKSTDTTPDSYFGWLSPSSTVLHDTKSTGSKSNRSNRSSSRDVGVVSPPCCGLLP